MLSLGQISKTLAICCLCPIVGGGGCENTYPENNFRMATEMWQDVMQERCLHMANV